MLVPFIEQTKVPMQGDLVNANLKVYVIRQLHQKSFKKLLVFLRIGLQTLNSLTVL